VRWTASDADGDTLTYDLLYSPDNGTTWQMAQMGLISPGASLDTSVLAGSEQARFKVIAHDGFNQGEALGTTVRLEAKAPRVALSAPADGTVIAYGQTLSFAAEVYDLQEGSLPVGNIEWRDQRGVLLGTGTAFASSDLAIGVNHITLTARNSAGQATVVAFTVIVDDDLNLPKATLSAAPDQIGWHVAAGTTTLQTATIALSNIGDTTDFAISVSENAPWLTVSPSAAATPLVLTLSADPTLLQTGAAASTVLQITGTANGSTQGLAVPVSLLVGEVTGGDVPPNTPAHVYLPVVRR